MAYQGSSAALVWLSQEVRVEVPVRHTLEGLRSNRHESSVACETADGILRYPRNLPASTSKKRVVSGVAVYSMIHALLTRAKGVLGRASSRAG